MDNKQDGENKEVTYGLLVLFRWGGKAGRERWPEFAPI
jgi:hypothetical protein